MPEFSGAPEVQAKDEGIRNSEKEEANEPTDMSQKPEGRRAACDRRCGALLHVFFLAAARQARSPTPTHLLQIPPSLIAFLHDRGACLC